MATGYTATVVKIGPAVQALTGIGPRGGSASYTVSYEAPQAAAIHEGGRSGKASWMGRPRRSGTGAYWDAQSGPGAMKYLEGPARQMSAWAPMMLARWMKMKTMTLAQATKKLAERLLDESRKIVPYEFGGLWKSGKVKKV